MKLANLLKRKKYSKVNLKLINTNHFEVKAKINGVKGTFILDTGASNSCIDINLAEKFNLVSEDSETKAAGAGASGMPTKVSENNTLELKEWKYKNFALVLLDLSHVNDALTTHEANEVDGIIGADILQKGKAIIDYGKKELFLKRLIFKY
ncbi:MAG TPA: retropepsin-like aspartic protease [Flavobacteriaceae bacterium]|nr:retropepsin-like aspartic protease [Flavobacteriaceae bacterium]